MEKLIYAILKKKKLEEQYGHLSCFDYPKQYNRMDSLADEIREIVKKEYQGSETFLRLLEDTLEDLKHLEVYEMNLCAYDTKEMLDNFIDTAEWDKNAVELLLWMSASEALHYLDVNCHLQEHWTDKDSLWFITQN